MKSFHNSCCHKLPGGITFLSAEREIFLMRLQTGRDGWINSICSFKLKCGSVYGKFETGTVPAFNVLESWRHIWF